MVTKVETSPFAGRPTTLGAKLIQDAKADLAKAGLGQGGTGAPTDGRVVEDTVNLSNAAAYAVADLGGQKVVNLASAGQSAAEVRGAKATDLPAALDKGLARGAHVGNLFRSVFQGLFSSFRARA